MFLEGVADELRLTGTKTAILPPPSTTLKSFQISRADELINHLRAALPTLRAIANIKRV
jgi:hypothetical protein